MLHLFDRVYLDHHSHLNSKYESLILSQNDSRHPLSKILGSDFGEIKGFRTYLDLNHNGQLDVFWAFLAQKNPSKRFVVFCDEELFLNLAFQFLKSLYLNLNMEHLYFVYQTYRQDYEMKALLFRERGDRHVPSFKTLFPKMTFSEFAQKIEGTEVVEVVRAVPKNRVSYEHIVGNYSAKTTAESEGDLREKILYLSWTRWCNEVNSLKTEMIKSIPNIAFILPDLVFENSAEPVDFCLHSPQLKWLFDDKFSPEYSRYLMKTYEPDFFVRIQLQLDLAQWRQFASDISVFEDELATQITTRMKNLYESNFKGLLQEDIDRQTNTDFFKGEQYFNVNHFLIHFLYKNLREQSEKSLVCFQLS